MIAKKQKSKPNYYNKLPRKVTQNEFNTFIKPCLSKNKRGKKPKISYYKIFNYILKVLRTSMQWDELEPTRKEISWQNVYHYHNRWSKDGSYRKLFENSIITLDALGKLDLSILHGDGSNVVAKKGVKKIGYSGHKHQKGEKILAICDNNGNIVAPLVVNSVNTSDMVLFDYSFTNLLEMADDLHWNLLKSFITLDAGFYSDFNHNIIRWAGMIPVIKPNPGARKNPIKLEQIWNDFYPVAHIYKERFRIERCFAWEDTYRKLAVRYEKRQDTFMGFRYLGYSMINFRSVFGKN